MSLFRKPVSATPQTKVPLKMEAMPRTGSGWMLLMSSQAHLEGALEVYRRLYEARMDNVSASDVRVEAVAWARASALMHLEFKSMGATNLSEFLAMPKANRAGIINNMSVLLRIGASLLLLAEDSVVEHSLVKPDEITGLLQEHADWRAAQAVEIARHVEDLNLDGPPLRYQPEYLPVPDLPGGMNDLREVADGHLTDEPDMWHDLGEILASNPDESGLRRFPQAEPRTVAWAALAAEQWVLALGSSLLYCGSLASDLHDRRRIDAPTEQFDSSALQGAADAAVVFSWANTEPLTKAIAESEQASLAGVAFFAMPDIWATLVALTTRDDGAAHSLALSPESLSSVLSDKGCCDFGRYVANNPEFLMNGVQQLMSSRSAGAEEEELLAEAMQLVLACIGMSAADVGNGE